MLAKEKNFSNLSALSATHLVLTALGQISRVLLEEKALLWKDSLFRKYFWKDVTCYRSASKSKGGKWTDKNLDKYLKSPADYAPGKSIFMITYDILGNAMAFAGVPNAKDRGDLIAFLKEQKWGVNGGIQYLNR